MIGEKIRKLRKEKGWSLDELGARSASSKSYIWELEKNDELEPSARKLKAIADALNVSLDYLVSDRSKATSEDQLAYLAGTFRRLKAVDQSRLIRIAEILEGVL